MPFFIFAELVALALEPDEAALAVDGDDTALFVLADAGDATDALECDAVGGALETEAELAGDAVAGLGLEAEDAGDAELAELIAGAGFFAGTGAPFLAANICRFLSGIGISFHRFVSRGQARSQGGGNQNPGSGPSGRLS